MNSIVGTVRRLDVTWILLAFDVGARCVVFPSSMGRFFEWEDRGMIEALGEHLERGWLQLYCVDSVDADSWYAKWKHPADRARAHAAYDAYVRDEVLPLTVQKNGNPFLMTAGASSRRVSALRTFALRYPHIVNRAIGLSGLYDIRQQTDGYSDATVYRYNPADFILGESDPHRLVYDRVWLQSFDSRDWSRRSASRRERRLFT